MVLNADGAQPWSHLMFLLHSLEIRAVGAFKFHVHTDTTITTPPPLPPPAPRVVQLGIVVAQIRSELELCAFSVAMSGFSASI
jgi:hypothetical protein